MFWCPIQCVRPSILFSEMGQPALASLAQMALCSPGRGQVERRGMGDNMRPRVIHTAIVEVDQVSQASSFLPSVPTRTRGR